VTADNPESLTIAEFCRLVDVQPHTVSSWIRQGLITVKRGPRRHVQIPLSGVAEFLPPAGDRLMKAASVLAMGWWTRSQLDYYRVTGKLATIATPSGGHRYLRSQITAAIQNDGAELGRRRAGQ